LLETRKAILHGWPNVGDSLDTQGEVILASEVREFARRLPRVLTAREHLATALVQHLQKRTPKDPVQHDVLNRTYELTR
jgi:hypothetical protein